MNDTTQSTANDASYPASVTIVFRRGRGRSKTAHALEVAIEWCADDEGKKHGAVRVPANVIPLTKFYLGLTPHFGMRVVNARTEDGYHTVEINPPKVFGALPPADAPDTDDTPTGDDAVAA